MLRSPFRAYFEVELSPADIMRIEEAIPPSAVAGTGYDEQQMKNLDSER